MKALSLAEKAFVNLADERIKNLPRRSDIDYIGFGENGLSVKKQASAT